MSHITSTIGEWISADSFSGSVAGVLAGVVIVATAAIVHLEREQR